MAAMGNKSALVGEAASFFELCLIPLKANRRAKRPITKFQLIAFGGCKAFKIDPTIIPGLIAFVLIPKCNSDFVGS